MKVSSHIICQQSIEIEFEGIGEAIGIQDRLAEIFYTRLQPRMNLLFDEIADYKYLLSWDRLEIDCGVLINKNWEDEWVDSVLKRLNDELRTMPRKAIAWDKQSNEEIEELILFVIEHGHLPWNSSVATHEELSTLAGKLGHLGRSFIVKLKSIFSSNDDSIKRCVVTFPETFIDNIINQLVNKKNKQWLVIDSFYREHKSIGKLQFAEAVLKSYSMDGKEIGKQDVLLHFFSRISELAGELNKKDVEQAAMNKLGSKENRPGPDKKKHNDTDVIYLSNAGLVILHPFFTQLFEIAGLTVENVWKDDKSAAMAIRIMHYLVNGNDKCAEFDCPFNKILCGLHPGEFVNVDEQLPAEIRALCDALLKEAIGYWVQLKNTGIEGFREAFLKRKGKLSAVSNGWLLQPEQKPIDVLLSHLPWGIGVVRLPWMKELLHTEW